MPQDLFAARNIHVNIPGIFEKKNRMSGQQVLADRKISSERVHIERIISLMKTYTILVSPLRASETMLACTLSLFVVYRAISGIELFPRMHENCC